MRRKATVKLHENFRGRFCKHATPGRGAGLIVDDSRNVSFPCKMQNGQQKVLAERAIHPTGAKIKCEAATAFIAHPASFVLP